jgi:hypothetical protein
MKTLIIPDIHQRIVLVEDVLKKESYDEVVFLGDWFDSFFEPPHVASFLDTCLFLRDLMTEHPKREKFTFLLGNHDIQYIYLNKASSHTHIVPVREYYSSGFTKNKAKQFRKVFFDNNLRDQFFIKNIKLAYKSQDFLFSHAGVMPNHLNYNENVDILVNDVLPDVWANFRNFTHNRNYFLSEVGSCRGGSAQIGGILWLDARHEFEPSKHIGKQIFGHTTFADPFVYAEGESHESWCLDTEKHYGVVDDGVLSVKLY